MKVFELEGEELAHWAAKARGITQTHEYRWVDANGDAVIDGRPYRPDIDWKQAGELIEEFCLGVEGGSAWMWKDGRCIGYAGYNPLEAICRAVVASVYGDEVEDK